MNRGTKGLEMWCRRQIEGYPGVNIHNMTTSWKDGMAFCALVHHFRPDLIDFDKLNKGDVYYNNELAFTLAEKHLGIPALLDASDMAMYDVPDRLSILTYLSQYYQRFASQESKIIKDKSTTIQGTTPPPQKMMAHIPKREPCKHCGLPVFFAERLAIDGSFYHRKCLRCARCDSQLTPGSFYETEVDGVFCCETCPDEETKIRLGDNNNVEHHNYHSELSTQMAADEQRKSFSEKLAMFQSNGKGLLQKSLSDEEKSKSLKRLTELYSKNSINDANDIKQTLNESDDVQIDDEQKNNDGSGDGDGGGGGGGTELSTCESSDNEVEVEEEQEENDDKNPPSLPITLPPSLDSVKVEASKSQLPPIPSKANVLNKLYGKNPLDKVQQNNGKLNTTTSEQIQTKIKQPISNNEQSSQIEQYNNSANNEQNYTDTPNTPTMPSQNDENVNAIESNLNTNNNLPLDALNSFTNVTKENAEFIEANNHNIITNVHHLEKTRDSNAIENSNNELVPSNAKNVSQSENDLLAMQTECVKNENQEQKQSNNDGNENKSNIDKYDTNILETIPDIRKKSISDNDSQKIVRSRLSQFEALVQSLEKQQIPYHSPRLNRNSEPAENKSRQSEQKESIQVNYDEKMVNVTNTTEEEIEKSNVVLELEPSTQLNIVDDHENNVNSNASIIADSDIISTSESNEFDSNKPVARHRATLHVDANNLTTVSPPTPSKRKQKSTSSEPVTDKEQMIENNSNNIDIDQKRLPENLLNNESNKIEKNYPNVLNPFGSDDDEDENDEQRDSFQEFQTRRKESLNPFDSEDDEIELLKERTSKKSIKNHRISTNPFGSDSENETDTDSLSAIRTPVPTPRKPINGSMLQSTPDVSPRMYSTLHPKMRLHADLHGSNGSLASSINNIRTSSTLNRSSKIHGSMSSLASTTPRHKKGRAPDIPTVKSNTSTNSSPSHSVRATPVSRKKRAAPLPPKHQNMNEYRTATSTHDDSLGSRHTISSESVVDLEHSLNFTPSIESNYVSSSNEISFEFKSSELSSDQTSLNESTTPIKMNETVNVQRKLIPVDECLLDDLATKTFTEMTSEEKVTYRRKIIPDTLITPIKNGLTDRQCEKMKENKESQNKNRQSQILMPTNVLDDSNQVYSPNKSSYGIWKRRKGPAPSLPIPPRKVIQMLPLQEIRHELEVIEVQQQGLEKQGVMLEKMIRERCEGTENENQPLSECKPNSKEVEDLILQLFELVNEKNELFRRQAELMYLRRQHRLEQEQADIEYEIRVLMAQPECNKTDSDKAREEALISRLVDVVQLRNEVIESLEMDRIREAEEDQSIKQRLEMHTAKRDEELCQQTPIKLSKKEKKKQKESKKLAKQKKMDADKDADESELTHLEKSKEKKKKKIFLF